MDSASVPYESNSFEIAMLTARCKLSLMVALTIQRVAKHIACTTSLAPSTRAGLRRSRGMVWMSRGQGVPRP